jgi:hypothetical protein
MAGRPCMNINKSVAQILILDVDIFDCCQPPNPAAALIDDSKWLRLTGAFAVVRIAIFHNDQDGF